MDYTANGFGERDLSPHCTQEIGLEIDPDNWLVFKCDYHGSVLLLRPGLAMNESPTEEPTLCDVRPYLVLDDLPNASNERNACT